MMPNDLEAGSKFEVVDGHSWVRRLDQQALRYAQAHPDERVNFVIDEPVGRRWRGEVKKVIPGTTQPYLVKTAVFFERGNLLLHPERTCEEQRFFPQPIAEAMLKR